MDELYFEDIEVGQSQSSGTHRMTRERIVSFANEFDPQPQHTSEAAAAATMFGELVASGWHTGSVTMRLQLDAMMEKFPGGSMGAQLDNVAWLRPVRPDDVLHVTVEVIGTRESKSRADRGVIKLRTTTFNQRDEPVQTMTASILVPRRPPG